MTFDQDHFEEDRFAELCKNLGVDAKVEYKERPSGVTGLMSGGLGRSPSGFVANKQFEILRKLSEAFKQRHAQ